MQSGKVKNNFKFNILLETRHGNVLGGDLFHLQTSKRFFRLKGTL